MAPRALFSWRKRCTTLRNYVEELGGDPGREIGGRYQALVRFQQIAGKSNIVQPVEASESGFLQPEIQIEPIHGGYDARHACSRYLSVDVAVWFSF